MTAARSRCSQLLTAIEWMCVHKGTIQITASLVVLSQANIVNTRSSDNAGEDRVSARF